MSCPVCKNEIEVEHNSHPAAVMARHLRNEHGYSLPDAIALMRATAPTASDTHAELAALREENARLREDNAALRREIEANVIEAVAAHDLQQHAERMAEAIKEYFNRRGVQHANRRDNEYIAEMADALSDYGFAINLKGGE